MPDEIHTRCCIAGGGPAGMMLGLLLARAGVDVIVLEKHGDFLRDFRGDTVHPSTLELMHELGLLASFLQRPHDEARDLSINIGSRVLKVADFSRLSTQCKFIALMPQWDFLDFLRDEAVRYPNFRLIQNARVDTLLEDSERVTGAQVTTNDGSLQVHADLVIGADGRHSTVREAAQLHVRNLGCLLYTSPSPRDVEESRMPSSA